MQHKLSLPPTHHSINSVEKEIEKEPTSSTLSATDQRERDTLINDIQNTIYALGFEIESRPRGSALNLWGLFSTLPWQKIEVMNGPKSAAMHEVLKAAILALQELNPDLLKEAKEKKAHHYDLITSQFGGTISLSRSYGSIGQPADSVKNQPGYLVSQMLRRVEAMLQTISLKYPDEIHHSPPKVRNTPNR